MLAKNKSGWILLEHLDIKEEEIGYVDACDLKIVEMVCKEGNKGLHE